MSVFALLIGPAAIVGVRRLVKRVRAIAKSELTSLGLIISVMQETAQGIRIVKAFNLEPIMRERMNGAIEAVRQRSNKINGISARTGPLMETLGGLAIAGVTLWSGYAAIYYDQKPGAFMSFITAILLAYEPAKRLASTRVQIEQGIVGVRAMFKLLDLKPTMDGEPGRAGPRRGGRARSSSSRSPSPIRVPSRSSAASISAFPPASSPRWSVRPAPARRPSST